VDDAGAQRVTAAMACERSGTQAAADDGEEQGLHRKLRARRRRSHQARFESIAPAGVRWLVRARRYEVCCCRGQYHDDSAEEEQHRLPKSPTSASAGGHVHRLLARVLDGELLPERAADRGQLSLSLIALIPGFRRPNHSQKVDASSVRGEADRDRASARNGVRCPCFRKLPRQHADDQVRLTVDPRGLPDDVGIASKIVAPQPMAEDDDQRRIRSVVAVVQEASSGGRYPSTSNALQTSARRSAFLRCRPRPGLHSNSAYAATPASVVTGSDSP